MKDFINNLKHQIKDPVTSVEDANTRKKLFTKYLLICLAVAIVSSVLMNLDVPVVGTVFTFIGLAAMIALFGSALCLIVAIKSRNTFENITCKSCGQQIKYDDNVKATVIDVSQQYADGNDKATLCEMTKVSFDCVCQKCGTTKNFEHTFCTRKITATTKNAKSQDYPLDPQIIDFFNGKLSL